MVSARKSGKEPLSKAEHIRAETEKIRTCISNKRTSSLQQVLNVLPYVLLEYDKHGKPLNVSGHALRQLGMDSPEFTRDEAMERLQFRRLDGTFVPKKEFPSSRALRGEIVQGELYRITLPDQSQTISVIYAMPARSNENKGGIILFAHDVTDLVFSTEKQIQSICAHTEEELRKANEVAHARLMDLETYFDKIPIGLATIDRECRYIRVNQYLADINGLPVSAHIGKSVREVLPDVANAVEDLLSEVLSTGRSIPTIESEVASKVTNELRTIRTSWFPLKDASGNITSIGVVVEEITQRRKLEVQLVQAQKMEAIGQLAGGIAHDFNNILAGIIGFGEMVEDELTPGSKTAERMERVIKAAYRGRDLVRKILSFSRQAKLAREEISAHSIIEEAITLLRPSLPTTIEIKIHLNAKKNTIIAAPSELEQIILNLATNAAHAMKQKGGVLQISTSNVRLSNEDSYVLNDTPMVGDYIRIEVYDTGIGMPPELKDRIFEPFFSTKSEEEGTGMGLSVVYGIVKDLQGWIGVESEQGVGSTFEILLPLAKSEREQSGESKPAIPKGNERILFVDDEELLTEWADDLLKRLGYTTVVLNDPQDALSLFQKDPNAFDVAILDQTMPVLTGYDLAREMLKLRSDMPIILCSGRTDTISPKMAKEAGIKEFLAKPFGRQPLAEAIRQVLRSRLSLQSESTNPAR